MLTIYKNTEQGMTQLESAVNGTWVNIIDPTPEEIKKLETWGVDPELVTDSLDLDEMARVEREEDYVFILLRIPYFVGADEDIPYITIPLGIIVRDNMILTVCKYESPIFKVLANGKHKRLKTGKRFRMALYIFYETAGLYLAHLREINRRIDATEDKLQKASRNRELLELLKYQKSLVYFTTALRSNEVMMERLQRARVFNQYDEDEELLEDVLTENQQAIQTANIQTEILLSMMDAFASIISNNLNVVMKALAAITIVINVPTIISSFYGMNVALPFQHTSWAFTFTIGLSFVMIFLAVYIFAKLDWF
ncbi:MAG: magnesium transporter CorA family protein [Anaerolineales bacterium]|nr:magnesium transporter CorA family protein [Anaerolineales bacterium]